MCWEFLDRAGGWAFYIMSVGEAFRCLAWEDVSMGADVSCGLHPWEAVGWEVMDKL